MIQSIPRASRTCVPLALVLLLTAGCGGADEAPRSDVPAEATAGPDAEGAAGAPVADEGVSSAPGRSMQDGAIQEEAMQGDAVQASAEGELPLIRVWKSPTCGCCGDWVDHIRAAGFPVEVHDVETLAAVKEEHGITEEHRSCHTATVDGYVVEGHVPADLVRRMLEERPEIRGLAVPGMPVGSPGMEVGDRKDPYDVLALLAGGAVVVYDSR